PGMMKGNLRFSGDDDKIIAFHKLALYLSESLAVNPLHAVPEHAVADFPADGEAHSIFNIIPVKKII
ncbi:MAG: hypothetical protein WBJ00_09805, partial [Dethiobacteria bacterium]